MPAWFDLSTLDEDAPENESAILRAVDNVHALLDEEIAKTRIPPKKVILGGFSQGGALALYAALTYHRPLAGILILSCWIPLHKTFPEVRRNVATYAFGLPDRRIVTIKIALERNSFWLARNPRNTNSQNTDVAYI